MMMVAFVLGLVIMMMKAHYKRGNPTPLALKQTSISFLLKPASFAQMAVFLASAIFFNLANTIQNIALMMNIYKYQSMSKCIPKPCKILLVKN